MRDDLRALPEARETTKKIVPISGMLYHTRKLRDRVGVLHSREQHLYSISRRPADRRAGDDYAGRLIAAWQTSLACGYPATFLTEEDVHNGAAAKHKLVILAGLDHASPSLVKSLEDFVRKGGKVLADTSCSVKVAGAQSLPFSFPSPFQFWKPYQASDANRRGDRAVFDRMIRPHVAALTDALSGHVRRFARVDNPMCMVSEHGADRARYVWVVNTCQEERPDTPWGPVAASIRLDLPASVPVVYDVFARRMVPERSFEIKLGKGQAALYALMPHAIHMVAIAEARGNPPFIDVRASVNHRASVIKAVVPVQVDLIDSRGNLFLRLWRATRKGLYSERIPVGGAPAEGTWHVRVTELLSGRSTSARFDISGRTKEFAESGLVDVRHAARIKASLRKQGRPVHILVGNDKERSVTAPLMTALKELGSEAIIATADKYGVEPDRDPRLPFLGGRAPLAINEQVILLGNRRGNPLISKLIDGYGIAPSGIRSAAGKGIGRGRAALFWATAAFGIENDIVVVYADDPRGLERGVKALAAILSGHPLPDRETLDAR
jgi:hypothetical protein